MKLSTFITFVASVTGESEGTVKLTFRTLREAGLIVGIRGKNALDRTANDAALFFCWIGLTDKPSLAPRMVGDFGFARAKVNSDGDNPLDIQNGELLLDVLANVILAEAAGKKLPPYSIEFQPADMSVSIDLASCRVLFCLEGESMDGEPFAERYKKPYRVTRTFPQTFVQALAAPFREG